MHLGVAWRGVAWRGVVSSWFHAVFLVGGVGMTPWWTRHEVITGPHARTWAVGNRSLGMWSVVHLPWT